MFYSERSHCVSEPNHTIGKLALLGLLLLSQLLWSKLLGNLVTTGIFSAVPETHEGSQDESHAKVIQSQKIVHSTWSRWKYSPDKANQDAVASDVTWAVSGEVHIRGNDAAAVPTHDLHRDTRSSL